LFPADDCPVDVAPERVELVKYLSEGCAPDIRTCMKACKGGDANACYAAALRTQELKKSPARSEALFLRACRLGIVSGCTNRAAGILLEPESPVRARCAARTFERMCRDVDRALRVLPTACLANEKDPACTAARELIEKIDGARRAGVLPP
jgi:hypothetical protein